MTTDMEDEWQYLSLINTCIYTYVEYNAFCRFLDFFVIHILISLETFHRDSRLLWLTLLPSVVL